LDERWHVIGGDASGKPLDDRIQFREWKPAGPEHVKRASYASLFSLGFINKLFGEFVSRTATGKHDGDFPGGTD
jgi:hypothetical protein